MPGDNTHSRVFADGRHCVRFDWILSVYHVLSFKNTTNQGLFFTKYPSFKASS
jgi:hypothetical protein